MIELSGKGSFDRFSGKIKRYNLKLNPEDYNGKIIYLTSSINNILDYFPYIKGIVMKEGGILSHVAIVSREFKMPLLLSVDLDSYIDDELDCQIENNKIIIEDKAVNIDKKIIEQTSDIRKLISNKLKDVNKEYTLDQIEKFYNNTFTYEEYLKTKNYSEEDKLKLYIKYMSESFLLLRYVKKELEKTPNYEDILIDKKIMGVHIKAIIDLKNINLSDENQVTRFGFYYGWLDHKSCANKESFYSRGKIVLAKLKQFNVENFEEDKDRLSQLAKYYEWRKLIWMRISELIINIDKDKIAKYVELAGVDNNGYVF